MLVDALFVPANHRLDYAEWRSIVMASSRPSCANGIQLTLTCDPARELDFADDIALFSHKRQGMQSKVMQLAKSRRKAMRDNTRNADKVELDGGSN